MLPNEQEQGQKLLSIPKSSGNIGSPDKTEKRKKEKKKALCNRNLVRKKNKCITKQLHQPISVIHLTG